MGVGAGRRVESNHHLLVPGLGTGVHANVSITLVRNHTLRRLTLEVDLPLSSKKQNLNSQMQPFLF